MGGWKKYCDKESCTDCNSIRFITKASRYCYDEKYKLPQIPKTVKYKYGGRMNVLATGIIGHSTHCDEYDFENFVKVFPALHYADILKEVCIEINIEYELFISTLNRLAKEIESHEPTD